MLMLAHMGIRGEALDKLISVKPEPDLNMPQTEQWVWSISATPGKS